MSYLCHVYLIMRSVNWWVGGWGGDPMQQPRTLIFHIINNDLEKGENKPWSLSPDLFSLQAIERAAPWGPWSSVSPFRLLALQPEVLWAITTPPTTACVIDECWFPWAFYSISWSNVPWSNCAIIHHANTSPNSDFVPSNLNMVSIFNILHLFITRTSTADILDSRRPHLLSCQKSFCIKNCYIEGKKNNLVKGFLFIRAIKKYDKTEIHEYFVLQLQDRCSFLFVSPFKFFKVHFSAHFLSSKILFKEDLMHFIIDWVVKQIEVKFFANVSTKTYVAIQIQTMEVTPEKILKWNKYIRHNKKTNSS